jgi:hypothetical protein
VSRPLGNGDVSTAAAYAALISLFCRSRSPRSAIVTVHV